MKRVLALILLLVVVLGLVVGCRWQPEVAVGLQQSPAETGAPPDAGPGGAPASAFCPEVPRPAVGLFIAGEGYLIADPVSGAECRTTLDGDVPGLFQAAGDALYYTVLADEQFVVKRLGQNGEASLLSFTAVDRDDALLYHAFVVSEDGSRIAWSRTGAGPDGGSGPSSTLWVANRDGSEMVNALPALAAEGADGQIRALVPVRFSKDNSTLYYTLQVATGGIWSAFLGRYDNLYALRLNTDAEPTEIFECPGERSRMCIGDFYEVEGQVAALAFGDGEALVIVDGMGEVRNRIALERDYLGHPLFGPGGDLVFYGADGITSILPDEATIYHVAAPLVEGAAAEVVASGPELSRPKGWLDAEQVVIGYVTGDDSSNDDWGVAVVGLDGSIRVIESAPAADFVDVVGE